MDTELRLAKSKVRRRVKRRMCRRAERCTEIERVGRKDSGSRRVRNSTKEGGITWIKGRQTI